MFLLIDGSNIARASHSATELNSGEFPTGAIFGFLSSIERLKQKYRDAKMIVLWDGYPQWRYDAFPQYKSNRKDRTEEEELSNADYKRQLSIIKKMLEWMGIPQAYGEHLEADDIAGILVGKLLMRDSDEKIALISGDKDWLCLVGSNVTWYDPIRDRSCDTENFLEFTGYFTQSQFLQGKALLGDNSDCVTGIPGMGDKTVREFIAQWQSVEKFFSAVDNGKYVPQARKAKNAKSLHPEQILASPEGRAVYYRNMRLMDLIFCLAPIEQQHYTITNSPPSKEMLKKLFTRLSFASVLARFDSFCLEFEISM